MTELIYANIFHSIFGMTVYVITSVIDNLVQAGSIKTSWTHMPPLYAHSMGSLDSKTEPTVFSDLQAYM